jgi:hypothetical protein
MCDLCSPRRFSAAPTTTVILGMMPFDYVKRKLLAVRCEAITPVNVTVSFAS